MLTVGLGIGATTTMFAVIHAALLRPLPYADPGRLVWIYTDAPPNRFRFSVADYLALEEQQTGFARVAGYTERAVAFSDGQVAERLRGRVVSWSYFELLGIQPLLGRLFSPSDGRPGAAPVVVVSHRFWQERLGGRPTGRTSGAARRLGLHGGRGVARTVDHWSEAGPLRSRAVEHPAAEGPFFHHGAGAPAGRRHTSAAAANCARSTAVSFPCGSPPTRREARGPWRT